MEQLFIHTARLWLGTPFMHQGRHKQLGCDCIGLIIGVLDEMGVRFGGKLPSECDKRDYSLQPQGKRLLATLNHYLDKQPLNSISAGQVVLMRFEKEPQHVGIIGEKATNEGKYLTLIHCYSGVGKVVEHHLDAKWRKRIMGVYGLNEVSQPRQL